MKRDFWSDRKRAVAAEQEQEAKNASLIAEAQERATQEEKSDEEILQELGLPDPETMVEGDDFSAFMGKAVPDRLRRRALRHLWKSNPVLANVDGLVDYGEDFTDAATVIEDLQTTYQVGKGMLKHVLEMAKQEAEKEQIAQAEEEIVELETVEEELPSEEPETITLAESAPEPVPTAPETDEDFPIAPPRRRMRFQFEQA